ncbi:hypothetical protein Pfo_015908 [Paulownia fortunei]|nr:hypothetical protein Pfo_015908 [Paulownia fortunei]
MGMIAGNEQEKSQLATEICNLSARATACANLHHPHTKKSPFINWYLVLRVNENADMYGIRKQYHKLALQLHPDKNQHSKAETAFKLVSEAYFCLSDSARRAAFDLERKSISCIKCNTFPHTNTDPPTHTDVKIRVPYQETSRFNRVQRRMMELRTKLKEEAIIIEKCLLSNATGTRRELVNARGTRRELPVFNPSDYQYKGYPQHRTINHKNLDDLRAGFKIGNICMHNMAANSSPVFRSERTSFMSRCASTREY